MMKIDAMLNRQQVTITLGTRLEDAIDEAHLLLEDRGMTDFSERDELIHAIILDLLFGKEE